MARIVLIFLIAIMISFPLGAIAAESTQEKAVYVKPLKSIGLVEEVRLVVFDQVKDGCWTNLIDVKNKIRYRLESEGISVAAKRHMFTSPKNPIMFFTVIGGDIGQRCATSYDLNLKFFCYPSYVDFKSGEKVEVGGFVEMWQQSGILVSAKDETGNKMVLAKVDALMDQFLADIFSARKNEAVIEAQKAYFNNLTPITEEEYDRLIKKK